jgi:hypothetical protein
MMVADKFLNLFLGCTNSKILHENPQNGHRVLVELHGPTCQAEEVSLCSTSPIHAVFIHLTET